MLILCSFEWIFAAFLPNFGYQNAFWSSVFDRRFFLWIGGGRREGGSYPRREYLQPTTGADCRDEGKLESTYKESHLAVIGSHDWKACIRQGPWHGCISATRRLKESQRS